MPPCPAAPHAFLRTMDTTNPGQTTTMTFPGLPSGATVGFQVLNAATGLVAIGRTELGVAERPFGSGNFVTIFVAPSEGDLYLVTADWNGGILTPELSETKELLVTAVVQLGSTTLGPVADYVKMYLGGETFTRLSDSVNYGASYIAKAVDVVKRRAMSDPPADESTLDPLVLDYLGILAALELAPAARDLWGSEIISQSVGDDPVEMTTYTNRAGLMDDLRDDLMRRLPAAQALAIPLLDLPRLVSTDEGPSIDEDDDERETFDPRDFSEAMDFATHAHGHGEIIPRTWRRVG